MNHVHRKPIRINDEIQCVFCGKSWGIKDDDIPPCETRKEHNARKLKELKTFLNTNPG